MPGQKSGNIELMTEIVDVNRTLVVIFDIEGFTRRALPDQARSVQLFIESLNGHLASIASEKPDMFSTGDGAVVSIGRDCVVNSLATRKFMDFVIKFTMDANRTGIVLRSSMNYSAMDRVLLTRGLNFVQGNYIQIGDAINIAARIIHYCEPKEILISRAMYQWIQNCELGQDYAFSENDAFTTKHGERIETYTYIPTNEQAQYLYGPGNPIHEFKKYNYFPPISQTMVEFFRNNGLYFELKKVISGAYESIESINTTYNMLSWHSVINVLTQLRSDPDDKVYVISRADRGANFWTQPRKDAYVTFLKHNARVAGGHINQTRIVVYNAEEDRIVDDNDIHFDLEKLHAPNSYFSITANRLIAFEDLNKLIFGVTISTKNKYAIISIPSPESMDIAFPGLTDIGAAVGFYRDYDIEHGPMRAIITAAPRYVARLIKEFEELLKDNQLHTIK